MKQFRQGDILLIRISERTFNYPPANTKILREGTITGHHHILHNGQIFFKPIDEKQVFAYVVAKPGCKLTHDEHATIEIPEGTYEVRRQKEVQGYVVD